MMLTMVASLLVALAAPPVAPQATPEQDEIMVMGQRLKDVQVRLGQRANGTFRCTVGQSSGSALIDREMAALTCSIARKCYSAGDDQGQQKKDCIARLWDPAIIQLAERLAGERKIQDAQD